MLLQPRLDGLMSALFWDREIEDFAGSSFDSGGGCFMEEAYGPGQESLSEGLKPDFASS